MTDNYLTVKEYASQANVSVQRVYQRLNEDLKQYVKVIKGKKMLSVEALQHIVKDDSNEDLNNLNKNALNNFKVLKEQNENFKIDLEKITTEKTNLISKYSALSDDFKILKDTNLNLKSDLEKIIKELDSLKIEIVSLKSENIEYKTKYNACNDIIKKLEADKDKLNDRLDKAEADRTALITNNNELTIALKAAQALHGMDKHQTAIEVDVAMEQQQQSQPQTSELEPPMKKPSLFARLFKRN